MVKQAAKKVVLTDVEGNYIVPVIDPADKGSGGSGLEICDIGMSLYVDETKGLRRYLNGQIVDINTNTQAFLDRLKEITTLHPSLLCTEEEWQTAKTSSAFGQVGKFVFNYSGDEIVSVRIPRVVNVQGLFDLQNLGMTVGAGLPNITGYANIVGLRADKGGSATGAFTISNKNNNKGEGSDDQKYSLNLNFNASRSNSIYGNSDTVQEEAIQYPYFIQIATGSETENNIVNDIELNNPYSLFDSKYSDHELNNLSWLKSEGQWNAKAVYPTAYDKLLKVYNGTETVVGLSVKLSTETYTDYDFVLNTADETFRLPIKNGMEGIFASGYKWSDKISKSLNITYTAETNGFIVYTGSISGAKAGKSKLYINDSIVAEDGHNADEDEGHFYVPVNKGDTYKITDNIGMKYYYFVPVVVSNGSLYFYVGETVQNANLIDAGRIGEQLATKTDMLQASGAGMPSNRYIDLTLGANGSTYTAPANGYVYIYRTGLSNGNATYIAVVGSLGSKSVAVTGSLVTQSFLPVRKGQSFSVSYSGSTTSFTFRFIYAEGEV